MIFINTDKPQQVDFNHETFKHLFTFNIFTKKYEQTTNFYAEFDQHHDLHIETTINDMEELIRITKQFLRRAENTELAKQQPNQDKLNKINEMLAE